MAWECAECNSPEERDSPIDAVCHHCGKPLCRGDRVVVADRAFSGVAGAMGRTAIHCRACKRRHHAVDIPLVRTAGEGELGPHAEEPDRAAAGKAAERGERARLDGGRVHGRLG
jgi:hypothetical protein